MTSGIFQTDQTQCYDDAGNIIACAGTGQDAACQAGTVWPNPRFVENSDTVTDALTGLMWPQNAGLFEFPLSFNEALDAVEEMNRVQMFGVIDWRLPERRELFSLISHANINPALPADNPFSNVFPGYYWTATPCARFVRQAWYVHFGGGRVFKGMKAGSYMVWPVKQVSGRVSSDTRVRKKKNLQDRFTVGAHTVTDYRTGLMWAKNADIANGPVKWMDALETVREFNKNGVSGFNDWRLPNIRELESITDMDRHSPAIAGCEAFEDIKLFYWSSTTSVYDARYAWTLYTEDGNLGVGYKTNPEFFVWCVRDG